MARVRSDAACFNSDRTPKLSVTYSRPPYEPDVFYFTETGPEVTNLAKPPLTARAGDTFGEQVRIALQVHSSTAGDATSLKSSCTTAYVNSNAAATCMPGTALATGTYYVRGRTENVRGLVSAWRGWWPMRIDATAPNVAITSSAYTSGGWLATKPSANTFTLTSTHSDVTSFRYTKDGGATTTVPAVANGTGKKATLSWNETGGHQLTAQAIDSAGNISTTATFTFGAGGAILVAPTQAGVKTTSSTTLQATAPGSGAGTVSVKSYWRYRGVAEAPDFSDTNGTTTGWTEQNVGKIAIEGVGVTGSVKLDAADAARAASRSRKTTILEVQACFTYSPANITRCSWTADPATHTTVTYVPHAFGDNFPTEMAGPGRVALWTGEFSTSAIDVSMPGYTSNLIVERTYNTFNDNSTVGVFGPGWAASFDGVDIGVAGSTVQDDTTFDGTITLVDDTGGSLSFAQAGTARIAQWVGTYAPVDEDAETSGATLKVTSTGDPAVKRLIFTQDSGIVTTWVWDAPRSSWRVQSVREPGSELTTHYEQDSQGRLSRIIAPVPPPGDKPEITCDQGAEQPGCRVLTIAYGVTTTAVGSSTGDVAGQVKAISYTAFDPDKSGGAGMSTTTVMTYVYDSAKRLVSATDVRTNLPTTYTYQNAVIAGGVPLLATVKPAGLAQYTLGYSSVSGTSTPFSSALLSVSRTGATVGAASVVTSAFRYDVPTNATGLADVRQETVAAWGQKTAPKHAFAIFPQGTAGNVGATPTTAQFPYANVYYTDDDGKVINSASYGAGAWQLTSTTYDDAGRIIQSLDERAIANIRAEIAAGNSVDPASYATITRYNADVIATSDITTGETTIAAGTVLSPAGSYVTDVWAPTAEVTAPNGSVSLKRLHTHTEYDEGAPTNGINPQTGSRYQLATSVTVTEADALSGSSDPSVPLPTGEPVVSTTLTGYDPIDGSPSTVPTSGWVLGQATSTETVVSGGTNIVSKTGFDEQGWVVETRQPSAAASGTGAGVTKNSYYTVGSQTGADSVCGGTIQSAAWAGLPCRTWNDTTTLPTTHTTKYNYYLDSSIITETQGTVTRTKTTDFDTAGRAITRSTSVAGLTGSTAIPVTTTGFDNSTGFVTTSSSPSGASIQIGFDLWGRQTTYTDTDGAVTTAAYNAAGQLSSITDPKGTTTYSYDSATEHRGLITSQTTTGMGTTTASYDAAGSMSNQTVAGQLTQTNTYDRVGQRSQLAYSTATGDIASWTLGYDIEGRTTLQSGPSTTGGTRKQSFGYDAADRLSTVNDSSGGTCATRSYTFDINGNRLTKNSSTYSSATCTGSATSSASKTWSYDASDRLITGANSIGTYQYDGLGRQTSLPGEDTPAGAEAGNLSVKYYDNDLAHTISQNGRTSTFSLDIAGRRGTQTSTASGTTTTVVRHYTDTSDNPGWITSTTGSTTTTTRYSPGVDGKLMATITNGVVDLDILDPSDSIVSTLNLSGIITVGSLKLYDEYGNTITGGPTMGAVDYGWLGGDERAADPASSLILMGARVYNQITGQFTTADPIKGGNTTAYAYPQDPINAKDISGLYRQEIGVGRNLI